MTVSSATNYIEYTGDGSTKAFSFPYYFLSSDDIKVQVNDGSETTTLVLNSDYTVSGVGDSSGGTVTLTTAYSSTYTILLYRYPSASQETAYAENGKFPAKSHEKALDKLTLLIAKMQWLFNYLTLKKPNFFANYYDAETNKISNLADPSADQDATTKSYVDANDATLQSSIDAEVNARKAADLVLQANINAEAKIRQAGDAAVTAYASKLFYAATHYQHGNDANGVYAENLGVTGDGVDCGAALTLAFDFIISNGGRLILPAGTINWGTTRYENTTMNGPSFRISGQGPGSTKFIWENVDPKSTLDDDENWTSETSLIKFGQDPTGYGRGDYFPSFIFEGVTLDYDNQRNKGGNIFDTMEDGAHPTPYSKGVNGMIDVYGCKNPIIRDCIFQNCWGNGLRFRKCFFPLAERLRFYDVSANEILSRLSGSESQDSDGGAIFFWGSYGERALDCLAYNTRVYVCDETLTASNGQVYNGTLCGYIGMWAEYSPVMGTSYVSVPPDFIWMSDEEGTETTDREGTNYAVFENCFVYGYVMGFKSESSTLVTLKNCYGMNCYLPASNASGMLIENGVYDMLQALDVLCPQNGYESQRATIYNGSQTGTSKASFFRMTGATAVARNYRAMTNSKGSNWIVNNKFFLYTSASLLNQLTSYDVDLLLFRDNFIRIYDDWTGGSIRQTATDNIVIESNYFYNPTENQFTINAVEGAGNWKINKNTFYGPVKISASGQTTLTVNDNTFIDAQPTIYVASMNGAEINRNYIPVFNSSTSAPIQINNVSFLNICKNYFAEDQDATNTALHSLISFSNTSSTFVRILDNVLEGDDGQTYGWRLVYLRAAVVWIEGNRTDGDATMVGFSYAKGPVFVGVNAWSFSVSTEYNKVSNLSDAFNAKRGDKIQYLLPSAGGAEGIIYDGSSWYTYGSIGSTATTD